MKFKQLLTITFILCLFALSGNAQKRFILENKGSVVNTRVFDNLDSAVAAIQTNDILYIPGGNFALPSDFTGMVIDKNSVSIIGAGHNPDSTIATGRTYLDGNITINGDYVNISGVYLTGSIIVEATTNDTLITAFSLSYSNVDWIRLMATNNQPNTGSSSFHSNIIRGRIKGGYTSSAFFSKNIIEEDVHQFNGSNVSFTHNIFLDASSTPTINSVQGVNFDKNIFRANSISSLINISNFSSGKSSNNVFTNSAILGFSTSYYIDNQNNIYSNISLLPTFVGGSLPLSFDYTFDFHHSGGNVGIYGGNGYSPIPRNPHIKSAAISTQTDNNGNLQIIFEVEAKQ
jgi:hypothetical protein